MTHLHKLDRFLVDRAFQAIVDASQRAPHWWAEQCGWALAAGHIIRTALQTASAASWVLLAINLFAAAGFVIVSRWPAGLAAVAGYGWMRGLWGFFVATDLLVLALTPVTARLLASLLCTGLTLSYLYFACCKPPRPRQPRRRTAVARGAA